MKIKEWLSIAQKTLTDANISTANLDCLVLLEDATSKDRAWLLAHPDELLTSKNVSFLEKAVKRRAAHEPLSYIRGKSEFFGYEFYVNRHTLEPRPETETMIEILPALVQKTPRLKMIIDVGTGCGAIAIVSKLKLPFLTVVGTDIDKFCIKVATKNAQKHNVEVSFRQGKLVAPFLKNLSREWLMLANLPYVPDTYTINEAAMFEPKRAIFGGSDGLDVYRELFRQILTLRTKPVYVLTESLPFQHTELKAIAKHAGFRLVKTDDFIQVFSLT